MLMNVHVNSINYKDETLGDLNSDYTENRQFFKRRGRYVTRKSAQNCALNLEAACLQKINPTLESQAQD